MASYNRSGWLSTALAEVRCKPDRKAIRLELEGHIIDKEEALISAGLDPSEASRRAIEAMGDPLEVGRQLNSVHKPRWGYIWIISKAAVVILLIVSVFSALGCDFNELLSHYPLHIEHINRWFGSCEAGTVEYSKEKLNIAGYAVSITDAKLYLIDGEYIISADIKVTDPRPWSAPPLFMGGLTAGDGSGVDVAVYFSNGDICKGNIFNTEVLGEFRYWLSWYFNVTAAIDSASDPVTLVYPYNGGFALRLYPKEAAV